MTNSRELVLQALKCEGPRRAPRNLWVLPNVDELHPGVYADIVREYPDDIRSVGSCLKQAPQTVGSRYEPGEYTDEWGCKFVNLQRGIIGEVKQPLVGDWNTDADRVRIPIEWLSVDTDLVNRECASQELFHIAGACPRPFEQLQFIRGTEQLMLDLMDAPRAFLDFLKRMHSFYTELLGVWAKTDVDALMFMDDWGSQRSLLVSPQIWRDYFKPMYREYAQIAHSAGKKLFMHSDGHLLAILPDLIEIGVDAANLQIFCMGLDKLRPYAGKITFWGEIDRQHLLPNGTTQEIQEAVESICDNLWVGGGCIAQCEFGLNAKPENVRQVFSSWNTLTMQG